MNIFSVTVWKREDQGEVLVLYIIHCMQTAGGKHQQETSACQRHPVLPTAHPGPIPLLQTFFFRQTSPVAPLNINYGKHFGLVPVLVSDFKSIYCLPPVDSLGLKKQVFSWWMAFIGPTFLRLSNKQHQHVCLSQISNGSLKWWGSLLRQKCHHWHQFAKPLPPHTTTVVKPR